MKTLLVRVWLDERCEDATKYGLLLVIVVAIMVTAVAVFGVMIESAFKIASQQFGN